MKTAQEFVDHMNANHTKDGYAQFSIDPNGRKYTRIVATYGGQRSVYCFIDAEGNIYKAAGWKAPAKGIRANLATLDLSRLDWNTGWMYAR